MLRALGFDDVWLGDGDYRYWMVLVSLRLWLQVGSRVLRP